MKTVSIQTGFTKSWFEQKGTTPSELLDRLKGYAPAGVSVLKVSGNGVVTLGISTRETLLTFVRSMMSELGEVRNSDVEDFTDDIIDRAG